MKADLLVVGISELVTADGAGAKHGRAMRELKTVKQATLAIVSDRVAWIGEESDWTGEAEDVQLFRGWSIPIPMRCGLEIG
jgi:imidazolonepropionase